MKHRIQSAVVALLLFAAACSDDEPPGSAQNQSGTINVQISGEELATDGFRFPSGSEVTIADGWEIEFQHVLVTIGKVTLSENPDQDPSDQSQTGAVVAEILGPWAVDLHEEGSVAAAGGEGTAFPIATITNQNLNGNQPLQADQRYAFGFDIVPATASAAKLNFAGEAEAEAAYAEMVSAGYSVLFVGTATFKGTGCTTPPGSTYDFGAIPTTVEFTLGFATPTSNVNCQNQENQGDPFPDEEFQRGVPVLTNAASVAQITLHVDHPFFSALEHEPALHFGQMAARLVGKPTETRLTIDDLVGVDPTAFTDGGGAALPWRICDGSALPARAQMGFAVASVPVDPAGNPAQALRDYRDFVHYAQSTLGHLNGGDGLCFVRRNYPSPP